MKSQMVNPELFKNEAPAELLAKSYYAYLDSIERIYGTTYLRFDCIEKSAIDNLDINKESIVGLPSIIIDIKAPSQTINDLFNIKGIFTIYNYESKWMVITTSTSNSENTAQEFFNFVQVGNAQSFQNYSVKSIQKENNLDAFSRAKIRAIETATSIQESSQEDIVEFLSQINLRSFSHVNVYNVGQGNCNALVDNHNHPLLYFDVGGGSGANLRSYPLNFKLCLSNHQPVILSHWDLDHFIAAVYDPQLLDTKWLVPVQGSLSNTAIQIASTLQKRGNLICWNNSLGNEIALGNHILAKCGARPKNKNSSGLAFYVNYGESDYILLPGDATFNRIPNVNNRKLIGMAASHHGSKASISGMPIAHSRGFLAYSYGLNNTHGHVHIQARNRYLLKGWINILETVNGSIAMIHNPATMNVPCNSNMCTLSVAQHF